ncbi:MAG TPA: 30S ribosomal protein S8 [Candidatus Saccharimonadales bacterium]|jgi:small subunit ribosomal protein S8|nr:30S ribosomal protein S8 [Candidatus Saccharimonadales bacterium]
MSKVSTDPIADMLTRIRNAVAARKSRITLPHSKMKESIAQLLKTSGFVNDLSVSGSTPDKIITIVINQENNNARINEIVRLSRPGRRQYSSSQEIPVVKRGRGIVVVSTSRGILTGDQAKKLGIGGELICKIY